MAINCKGILTGWGTIQVTEYWIYAVASFTVKSAIAKKFCNMVP
jgi:hypothetical protein